MSHAVSREDKIKTHIVFAAGVFAGFVDADNELWRGLYYQLAHECGHVHDRRAFDIAFPNFLLTRYEFEDHLDAWYFQMGDGSRCEYTASRLSAEFDPDQIALHEESFMLVFEGLGARILLSSFSYGAKVKLDELSRIMGIAHSPIATSSSATVERASLTSTWPRRFIVLTTRLSARCSGVSN